MSTANDLSVPPGNMGLPLVGETLNFVGNMYRFLEERQQRYGNVFKSNVFGRKIVFLAGTKGAEAFYNRDNITRVDAHPFPLVDLFGGVNMEMYDGPKHFALKSIALKSFDRGAIADYLPRMQSIIEATLKQLSQLPEFSAVTELRRLSIAAICANLMGLMPGASTDAIARDYRVVLSGLGAVPLSVPGLPYRRAQRARDRLFVKIHDVIRERRAHPSDDGLSRMLITKAADGTVFTNDEAALEVHHIVIAGFIVYAHMAEAVRQLAQQPELRGRCAAEIQKFAPSGSLTMDALSKLDTCTNVILETKRYVPLVALAFGRAQQDFAFGGYQVPKNWTVYLALWLNSFDITIFKDPKRFDPDRFAQGRAEHRSHPMAFIPQGAEPPTGHRCLGLDYSTILSVAFLALLVRGYDWELPAQNLEYNWRKIPPEPRDGMRVRLHAK